jgi:hypothetical protein
VAIYIGLFVLAVSGQQKQKDQQSAVSGQQSAKDEKQKHAYFR